MESVGLHKKTVIGIDNGITGTIGIINGKNGIDFLLTPIIKQQDYTKKKKNITRIDSQKLIQIFKNHIFNNIQTICIIERPMVNPQRFNATISAVRALENTLSIIESMEIPYLYIDSKEWQKKLLPNNAKGNELKKASHDIGIRLFPQFKKLIKIHKDADGILIAEYANRYLI